MEDGGWKIEKAANHDSPSSIFDVRLCIIWPADPVSQIEPIARVFTEDVA
jgi:hypothetical protein